MHNYLSEAFKQLDVLDEDIFDLDKDGLQDLADFKEDGEEDIVTVVDPDADDEEDLEDSYIGKIILDCITCHTDIYKDREDITIDEDGDLANIGEECPYCFSNEGYKIVGVVKPFVETEFETEDDVDVEVDGEEVEEDEDEMDESFSRKEIKLKEGSYDRFYDPKDLSFTDYVDNRLIKDVDALLDVVYDNNGVKVGIVKVFDSAGTRSWIPTVKFLATYSMGRKYGYNIKYETNQFLYRSDHFYGLNGEEIYIEEAFNIVLDKLNSKFNTKKIGKDKILVLPKENESFSRKGLKESCSINQCQKWVDYDMKKYKKISDDTMKKIKSSGYSVVKDQYGDYEVIADRKDESCEKRKSRKMKESIEDITIDTGDQEIQVSARDKEKEPTDDEMIAPLSDEEKIEMASEEEKPDEDIDVDFDEFSEEEFDELGESYLKKVYENVKNYKTTSIKSDDKKLYIEGLIKFNSGKEKKTSFIFESKTITKNGKAKLIGENLQISKGHKSFKLGGTLKEGKFISESLNYNYRAKDGNESKRVYGTVKVSK